MSRGHNSVPIHPPILLDVTRLLNRSRRATPTGIDRVELAYAKWFARQETGAAITTRWPGMLRVLDRGHVKQVIQKVEAAWNGSAPSERSTFEFDRIRRFLAGSPGLSRESSPKKNGFSANQPFLEIGVQTAWRDAALLLSSTKPSQTMLRNSVFLHVSHTGLQHTSRIKRLLRPGAPAIFFVHDLIPIDAPEFCRDGEDLKHQRRIHAVAAHASLVIVNSHSTESSFREHCKRQGWRPPPIEVIPLGVEPAFTNDNGVPVISTGVPYFVMVGTIEPRKNHLLLLLLWRQMAQQSPLDMPRLVIIGRRGWENENVVDLLDRCELLRDNVIEVADLDDRHVAALMRGARAVLAPSFIEGYGLPIAEALSAGTPVIASDIPAHREAGRQFAEFIDPLNGHEWLEAIKTHSKADARSGTACKPPSYKPMSWSDHFTRVEFLLQNLSIQA